MVTIVVGGFYGDEGKGKIISYLALNDDPAIIARAGVGPNAGHTVYKNGKKYGLRMLSCGFVNPKPRLFIGAGVLVNPELFLKEIEMTETEGRAFLDKRCAIIEEKHRQLDVSDSHLKKKIGTTGSGCGPANAERADRKIKLAKDIPELKDYLVDVPLEVNNAIDAGKNVLIEASQGFGLSLFYGSYPFVTSKDTSASMAATDIGIGPTKVDDVMVVFKAYLSRVGEGEMYDLITEDNISKYPMWQRILEEAKESGIKGLTVNETLAEYFGEKGTVTGRPRRIGSFDFEMAKYSSMVNGATQLAVTCVDRLFPNCNGVKEAADLPQDVKDYIKEIETKVGVKVSLISTGPNPEDLVDLR